MLEPEHLFNALQEKNCPVVVFGASTAGRRIYTALKRMNVIPVCFCDNYRRGYEPILNIPIISPSQMAEQYPNALIGVCISNIESQEIVVSQLKEIGFPDKQIFTFDAITEILSEFDFDWMEHELCFDWHANDIYVEQMAQWIDEQDSSVIDFGAGHCHLKNCLCSDVTYIPVDYTARSPEHIVFDFNVNAFPQIQGDVCFLAYCLAYVKQTLWKEFLSNVFKAAKRKVIIGTGIVMDDVGIKVQKLAGAKTYFYSPDEIINVAINNGFLLAKNLRFETMKELHFDRVHLLFLRKDLFA